jgi:hypothetical protein
LKNWFKKRATADLVVRRKLSPRAKLMLTGSVVTVAILAAGSIYNYGLSTAGFERLSADRQQSRLQEDLERQAAENQELRDSLARSERSLQMNETAFQELERSLKASSQEIVKLREELNFYRNIITPADKKSGLRIQNLYIEPTGANQYRYKLVLIQALKHERTINGLASLEISGMQGADEAVLTFPGPGDQPLRVNFKYFQDLEGRFELPKNFKPSRVRVNVKPAGSSQSVEESYAWPQAQAHG